MQLRSIPYGLHLQAARIRLVCEGFQSAPCEAIKSVTFSPKVTAFAAAVGVPVRVIDAPLVDERLIQEGGAELLTTDHVYVPLPPEAVNGTLV